MAMPRDGERGATEAGPTRRRCLLLLGLASVAPLLSACSAGCNAKSGAGATACQQRQAERAAVRDRNRGWGR